MLKWGHAADSFFKFDSYGYKSYLFFGDVFSLKFPQNYVPDVADGKKYPIIYFFMATEKLELF